MEMPLNRVLSQKNSLRDSLVMTMLIVPFASTKSRHPWSSLGACTSCKSFHYIAYDALLPHQPTSSCKDCIVSHVGICEQKGQPASCPSCSSGPIKVCAVILTCKIRGIHIVIQSKELIEVIRREATSSQPLKSTVVLLKNDFQSSTKLDALIRNLRKHDLIPSLV